MFDHLILLIEFVQNANLKMALCGETNDINTGVAMFVKNGSSETTRTTDFVLKDLFQTKILKSSKPDTYILRLRPLTQDIVITSKPKGFVAQYSFVKEKQMGVIQKIVVSATESPRRLEFEIFATYRNAKDAPVINLIEKIVCPDEFTNQLYNFFMNK
jgi:hypothetical protein